mgnify:CR=1 FL=1
MSLVDFIVGLYHFQEICPSISQVLEFVSLDIGLKGVFEEEAVMEFDIEVDGSFSHVAEAEGEDGAITGEG